MKLIIRWLLLAAALLLVAHLYSGVQVASFTSAMIAALVLGLLNTLVRPLLVLLTLPVTLLTLGLFLFVINALMFWAAASLLDGFNVAGFGAALIGSLIYSLAGVVIDVAMERLFSPAASRPALRRRIPERVAKDAMRRSGASLRGLARLALGAQFVDQRAALALEIAQARIDHRRLDEVLRGARARQALAGAQAIDRAVPVAQRGARLGLRAHRTQRLAQALGA